MQRLEGFYYFYIEQIHPEEGQKEIPLDDMIERARRLYEQHIANQQPPLLVMFLDVAGLTNKSDIQVGFIVPEGTPGAEEARVRYVPPTLCTSLLAWGDVNSLAKSYGPILDFMKANGYPAIEGWREYYLYWEGEASKNNITWVQHVAGECER